jgi:hypothetical protein
VTVPIVILGVALLALVVLVVSAPLRAAEGLARPVSDSHELESERDAKYREIRDAELDFRTGKLSPEDYAAVDAQLRAEALEILDRLEAREEAEPRSS